MTEALALERVWKWSVSMRVSWGPGQGIGERGSGQRPGSLVGHPLEMSTEHWVLDRSSGEWGETDWSRVNNQLVCTVVPLNSARPGWACVRVLGT